MKHAFFLVACALAASAHASYGQMRLDGVGLAMALILIVGHGLVVDGALFVRLFRYRAALVAGSLVAAVLIFFLLSQLASSSERTGFFKGPPGGPELVVLVVTSAVFVPFIVIAPFAQYGAMRKGRRWPDWIAAWMAVQFALLPGFLALRITDQYFWQQEQEAGHAEGSQVKAGGFGSLSERAGQRHERIWGTGWSSPWPNDVPSRPTGWSMGLALGLDGSALIASNEPLSEPDRAALQTLVEKHLLQYGAPRTRAKLLWDALEPGGFAEQLAPQGVNEGITVSEEVIPVLLERLEQDGGARLCPGGRMLDADRAVLNALIQKKGQVWNAETRAYDMHPEWDGYRQRVERLCAG